VSLEFLLQVVPKVVTNRPNFAAAIHRSQNAPHAMNFVLDPADLVLHGQRDFPWKTILSQVVFV
jgi:hypothetical protein